MVHTGNDSVVTHPGDNPCSEQERQNALLVTMNLSRSWNPQPQTLHSAHLPQSFAAAPGDPALEMDFLPERPWEDNRQIPTGSEPVGAAPRGPGRRLWQTRPSEGENPRRVPGGGGLREAMDGNPEGARAPTCLNPLR